MNDDHTDDLLGVIKLLGDMTEKVVRLRDDPCPMKGRARQRDLFCRLSIMEISLRAASDALRDIVNQSGG